MTSSARSPAMLPADTFNRVGRDVIDAHIAVLGELVARKFATGFLPHLMNLPGFYFDGSRGKWFKIEKSHVARELQSSHSAEGIKGRQKVASINARARIFKKRRDLELIKPARILADNTAGNLILKRELGHGSPVSSYTTSGTEFKGKNLSFTKWNSLETGTQTLNWVHAARFVERNERHGATIVASGRMNGLHTTVHIYGPPSGRGNVERVHHRAYVTACSLARVADTKYCMTGAINTPQAMLIVLDIVDVTDVAVLRHTVRFPLNRRHPPTCSASSIDGGSALLALGMRGNTTIHEINNAGLTTSAIWPGSPSAYSSEPTAMTFLHSTPRVLATGCRSGMVVLDDLRVSDARLRQIMRLRHPSAIVKIWSVDEHNFLVAGIQDRMGMYDMRMVKSPLGSRSPGGTSGLLDGASVPYLEYAGYENDADVMLPIDASPSSGLICVANRVQERHMQLLNMWTGQRVGGHILRATAAAPPMPGGRSVPGVPVTECVKLVQDGVLIGTLNGWEEYNWSHLEGGPDDASV